MRSGTKHISSESTIPGELEDNSQIRKSENSEPEGETVNPGLGDRRGFDVPETLDDSHFSTVPLTARSTDWAIKNGTTEVQRRSFIGAHQHNSSKSSILAIRTKSPDPAHGAEDGMEYASLRLFDRALPISDSSLVGVELRSPLLQKRFSGLQLQRESHSDDAESIDWDFWGAVMADYTVFARDRPDDLAKAIEHGIPHALRGMMWQLMSASKDPELESVYADLLKEKSPHEKAILRDLGRTFPHHEYFMDGSGVGQENLFNVLKAYSLYDPTVGYCQGLPFLTAILLLIMPDEEAFCLLVRLMQSYGLSSHFQPEMPGLQLCLFQFERLIEEFLPVLHVHFLREGVKSSMFASQWFLTMFSYRFPLETVFRIFDNCLATGIEVMFRFAIVLLIKNEDLLLTLKFDGILTFLKNQILDRYRTEQNGSTEHPSYEVNKFVSEAFQLRITPFTLDNYANEWHEAVRIRDAHAVEMDELRSANRVLKAQVQQLEKNMVQLNEEHCEMAKQLVMARLRHEELENELVTYKLLYADAMHQNEQTSPHHRHSSTSVSAGKM